MPDWGFVLTDQSAVERQPLGECTPITLTFTRNTAPEIRFGCPVEAVEATEVITILPNGLPRVKAYRDGTLRLYAEWSPMEESAEETDAGITDQLQGTFRGSGAGLEARYTAASVTFTGIDAGTIAWNLINTANGESHTGIIQGTIATTVNRDRTYEHKQVLEAIDQLTGVDNGFDYEITPTEVDGATVLGKFNVYASQGSDKSGVLVFDFGADTAGTLQAVRRTWQLPVNKVRVLGEDGLTGTATNATSVTKYRQRMTVESVLDISEQATLNARATALLRPNPIEVVEFTPDPAVAPQPWTDYWLGDRVTVRSRHGSLAFERTVRINQIEVEIDAEGNEVAHRLAFEEAP